MPCRDARHACAVLMCLLCVMSLFNDDKTRNPSAATTKGGARAMAGQASFMFGEVFALLKRNVKVGDRMSYPTSDPGHAPCPRTSSAMWKMWTWVFVYGWPVIGASMCRNLWCIMSAPAPQADKTAISLSITGIAIWCGRS